MADTTPQRVYRAACPSCGASVEFRSAQSAYAVCSYCRTTVVRQGDTLARIGKMAEVFEDYSPLQLGASGRRQGLAFTLVGRLQYKGPSGAWTEWNAVFDDGTSALLAEDNGSYVFSLPAKADRPLPPPKDLRVGATTAIFGRPYSIASNEEVMLVSAQGELPKLPPLDQRFAMVELRSADGEVFSVDYGSTPPLLSAGRAVVLEDLQLTGLREGEAKEEKGRQFSCPHCGAPVEVTLSTTKSITCRACNALIDVSSGTGGELAHALQDEPVQPLVPLGSSGQLLGQSWQVVGYQHRMGHEPGDDESFGWDEYLLYNAKRGFTFLVDDVEGWSIVKPVTGAPQLSSGGGAATYLGTKYALKEGYEAETTYVAGEFYWPVERGQKTFNKDFASGANLLSMEETPKERTWSLGSRIASDTVAQAFKLDKAAAMFKRADAGPTSAGAKVGCGTIVILVLALLILLALMKACTDGQDRSGYTGGSGRSSGGAFGGFSGGGGHK